MSALRIYQSHCKNMLEEEEVSPYYASINLSAKPKKQAIKELHAQNTYFLKPHKRDLQRKQLLTKKYEDEHLIPSKDSTLILKNANILIPNREKTPMKLHSSSSQKTIFEQMRKRLFQRRGSTKILQYRSTRDQQTHSTQRSLKCEDGSFLVTDQPSQNNRYLRATSQQREFNLIQKLIEENTKAKLDADIAQKQIQLMQNKIQEQRKQFVIQKALYNYHIKNLKKKLRIQNSFPSNQIKKLLADISSNGGQSGSQTELKEANTASTRKNEYESDEYELKIDSLKDDFIQVR